MNVNTAKPPARRKRAKRVVENADYASFARRILRAYARRVADGDVEALRQLVLLPSDVDAITRTAVRGLREFGYSWTEIAGRLGVSRQAAQMRYADRAERHGLDKRLVAAGLAVTVATLVEVFADHHPGSPRAETCPGCRYEYPEGVRFADCPTTAAVRPVLYRRRAEDKTALARLSPDQYTDLHNVKAVRALRWPAPASPPRRGGAESLFLLTPGGST
jgi:hypothetical protein